MEGGLKQKTTERNAHFGYVEGGVETEGDIERLTMDVWEIGVKQMTTEKV